MRTDTLAGTGGDGVVAASAEMCGALARVRAHAARAHPILLVGATGTGKEVLAREAHAASGRRGPFVDINCGALPAGLVEAILFGSRHGAYTGSVRDVAGAFEQAGGGTLYLDELCSLPLAAQPILLRAIDLRAVRRVGDDRVRPVDVRIVASVQEEPSGLIQHGRLRQDLYYRLAVGVVRVPPLRHRPADLQALAMLFAKRNGVHLSLRAMSALLAHDWPGNVRELESVIARASAEGVGNVLGSCEIVRAINEGLWAAAPAGAAALHAACVRHAWNIRAVAAELGLSRSTAYRHMKAFRLERPRQGARAAEGSHAVDRQGDHVA